MKVEGKLKVVLAILIIILVSLVSFGGIYIQNAKFLENIIPEYKLGLDLKGGRLLGMEVDTSKNTVIYDKDGNEVKEEGEGTTKKEVPVNPEDTLTLENYKQTKKIMEKRLKEMNVSYYTIRQNETDGKLYVELPENSATDSVAQYMAIKGVFTVVNDDGDVLLNNSHIKNAKVGYNTSTDGTTVFLTIQLNKEGTSIFKDITNTYVKSTDSEGNDTTKKITLKIDESTLLNTYFTTEISNGMIQMSIGSASTDTESIQNYIKEASNIAVLLNSGNLPLTYSITENRYVMTDITNKMLYIPAIVVSAIVFVGIIFLVIKYRKNGLLSSISLIGYIATLLLVLRYANVTLTIEGLTSIVIAIIMDYIFTVYLMHLIKNSESESETSQSFRLALIKTLLTFVPVVITSVVLCFAGWLPIYSYGMVAFWGLLLIVLYNLLITRTLIVNTAKNK